jgi:hypothetical protein
VGGDDSRIRSSFRRSSFRFVWLGLAAVGPSGMCRVESREAPTGMERALACLLARQATTGQSERADRCPRNGPDGVEGLSWLGSSRGWAFGRWCRVAYERRKSPNEFSRPVFTPNDVRSGIVRGLHVLFLNRNGVPFRRRKGDRWRLAVQFFKPPQPGRRRASKRSAGSDRKHRQRWRKGKAAATGIRIR